MTIEDWLFAASLMAAMFFGASFAIFLADMVYDKFSSRRRK